MPVPAKSFFVCTPANYRGDEFLVVIPKNEVVLFLASFQFTNTMYVHIYHSTDFTHINRYTIPVEIQGSEDLGSPDFRV